MTPVGTTLSISLHFRQTTLEKEKQNSWRYIVLSKLLGVDHNFEVTNSLHKNFRSHQDSLLQTCHIKKKNNPTDNVLLFSIKLGIILRRKRNTDCQQTVLSLTQKTGAICQNWGWFGLSNEGILRLIGSERPPICALCVTQMEQDAAPCHGNQHSLHRSAHTEHGVWVGKAPITSPLQ